jgi:hypothetical protein
MDGEIGGRTSVEITLSGTAVVDWAEFLRVLAPFGHTLTPVRITLGGQIGEVKVFR